MENDPWQIWVLWSWIHTLGNRTRLCRDCTSSLASRSLEMAHHRRLCTRHHVHVHGALRSSLIALGHCYVEGPWCRSAGLVSGWDRGCCLRTEVAITKKSLYRCDSFVEPVADFPAALFLKAEQRSVWPALVWHLYWEAGKSTICCKYNNNSREWSD